VIGCRIGLFNPYGLDLHLPFDSVLPDIDPLATCGLQNNATFNSSGTGSFSVDNFSSSPINGSNIIDFASPTPDKESVNESSTTASTTGINTDIAEMAPSATNSSDSIAPTKICPATGRSSMIGLGTAIEHLTSSISSGTAVETASPTAIEAVATGGGGGEIIDWVTATRHATQTMWDN